MEPGAGARPRVQVVTYRSELPEASRYSLGWNWMMLTGAEWDLNSVMVLPRFRSHNWGHERRGHTWATWHRHGGRMETVSNSQESLLQFLSVKTETETRRTQSTCFDSQMFRALPSQINVSLFSEWTSAQWTLSPEFVSRVCLQSLSPGESPLRGERWSAWVWKQQQGVVGQFVPWWCSRHWLKPTTSHRDWRPDFWRPQCDPETQTQLYHSQTIKGFYSEILIGCDFFHATKKKLKLRLVETELTMF